MDIKPHILNQNGPSDYKNNSNFRKTTTNYKNNENTSPSRVHKKLGFDLYSGPNSKNTKSNGKNSSKSPISQKYGAVSGFSIDYAGRKSHKFEGVSYEMKEKQKHFENFNYDIEKKNFNN